MTSLRTHAEVLDFTEKMTILIEKTLRNVKVLDPYEETLLSICKIRESHYYDFILPVQDESVASEKLIEIINGGGIGFQIDGGPH